MTVVIEESEDISSELISCLLNTVKNYDKVNVCLSTFIVSFSEIII